MLFTLGLSDPCSYESITFSVPGKISYTHVMKWTECMAIGFIFYCIRQWGSITAVALYSAIIKGLMFF